VSENKGDVTRFTTVDRQADPRFFIEFLDAGNAHEEIKRMKRIMIDQLDLLDGHSLLDVGSGTGDDVRDLARLVAPRGRVVGLDFSGAMIAEARTRHGQSGLPVEFVQGDAQQLEFPDATFDRCRTERMLMHLDRPERALAEMVRVVRPGGRVVVFDFDWDTVFADIPDKATTRKIVRSFSDSMKHGWIGRSLPRLFRAAGLTDVVNIPYPINVPYTFSRRLFDGHLARAKEAGTLSADEVATWWTQLEKADAAGHFNVGFLGFIVGGTRAR
jgi:ubiquinone/menaquinone biosynthesis C-methylase UbiE